MTTLAEIETAVDLLSGVDQQALMRRLASKLRGDGPAATALGRQAWMRRLADLRASLGAAPTTATAEQILDDLRSE